MTYRPLAECHLIAMSTRLVRAGAFTIPHRDQLLRLDANEMSGEMRLGCGEGRTGTANGREYALIDARRKAWKRCTGRFLTTDSSDGHGSKGPGTESTEATEEGGEPLIHADSR